MVVYGFKCAFDATQISGLSGKHNIEENRADTVLQRTAPPRYVARGSTCIRDNVIQFETIKYYTNFYLMTRNFILCLIRCALQWLKAWGKAARDYFTNVQCLPLVDANGPDK